MQGFNKFGMMIISVVAPLRDREMKALLPAHANSGPDPSCIFHILPIAVNWFADLRVAKELSVLASGLIKLLLTTTSATCIHTPPHTSPRCSC